MKINLNDKIRVQLTGYGVKTHFEYYNKFNMLTPANCMPNIDDKGYTEYQLHVFMAIFGPKLVVGNVNVIYPFDIELVEEGSPL